MVCKWFETVKHTAQLALDKQMFPITVTTINLLQWLFSSAASLGLVDCYKRKSCCEKVLSKSYIKQDL